MNFQFQDNLLKVPCDHMTASAASVNRQQMELFEEYVVRCFFLNFQLNFIHVLTLVRCSSSFRPRPRLLLTQQARQETCSTA